MQNKTTATTNATSKSFDRPG